MQGRSWFFYKSLLVVKEYTEDISPSEITLDTEVFWIQIHDLPFRMTNKKTDMMIGNSIGKCVDVDTKGQGGVMGNSLRMRVEINITKPLR